MNVKNILSALFKPMRFGLALLTATSLVATAHAAPIAVQNRYLLVFDTSSAMKDCQPMLKDAIGQLFISMMNGQLQDGDTIGVWTFARNVQVGHFPLQTWQPDRAGIIASNVVTFIRDQHYGKTTDFSALFPLLDRVVQNSDRLTVIIFCDGDGQFSGTPYDAAVNTVFKNDGDKMQKAKRPFAVVLRSQLGGYVRCLLTELPGTVTFPNFPPLPEAPTPLNYLVSSNPPATQPMAPATPLAPTSSLPPLIIVGTQVGTNLPASQPGPGPEARPVTTTAQLPPVEVVITNVVTVTNEVAAVSAPGQSPNTNALMAPAKSGLTTNRALAIGAGLLVLAVILTVWMLRQVRQTGQSSLITRSLDQKPKRPPEV